MGVDRNRLQASKAAAQAARDAFASKYLSQRSDLAVGLGLNESGDDWAVVVFAKDRIEAGSLPDHFGPFAVQVQITGPVKAF